MAKCAFRLGGTADSKISAQIQGAGASRNRKKTGDEAELQLLPLGEAAPEKKGRLHDAPSAQHRYGDQAEGRPRQVSFLWLPRGFGTCCKTDFNRKAATSSN